MADTPMPKWLADNWEAVIGLGALEPVTPCEVEGCPRDSRVRGLCYGHYSRARYMFDPTHPQRSNHD